MILQVNIYIKYQIGLKLEIDQTRSKSVKLNKIGAKVKKFTASLSEFPDTPLKSPHSLVFSFPVVQISNFQS
jgi:hypothetical protein